MERVVAQVRWRPPVDPDVAEEERDAQWVELAGPLFERSAALGGRVVAWADRLMTIDFAWDGLYDAVDFLVDAPLLPELQSGLCLGELDLVQEGSRIALASGAALREVTLLSELARPGEVLVSPELVAASGGRVGHVGEVGPRPGRPRIPALVLDPERPLKGSMAPMEEESFELVPAGDVPSSRAPEALREKQVARLADATAAVQQEAQSMFPAELAKALKSRDSQSLEALADSTRVGPSSDVAERLDAMAQLAGGRSGEAIRRLRVASDKVKSGSPAARSRAALALAVALGAAGRTQEALLECLKALARAREAEDIRGERACARFLAQVAVSMNDERSAQAWQSRFTDLPA